MTKPDEPAPPAPTKPDQPEPTAITKADEPSTALTKQPELPTNEVLVRGLIKSVAVSPTNIQRGEIVFVGSDGGIWGRRKMVRLVHLIQIGIYGGVIAGALFALSGFWVTGALLYFGGVAPLLHSKYRGTGTLMAIETLARQGHLDEAQRRLDEASAVRRRNAVRYAIVAGNLASHRGDHAAALRWWREALPRMKPGIARELVKSYTVSALARSGDLVEARRVFADVKLPPKSDEILTGKILGELVIALHANEQLSLELLHEWARRVLAYSHTGVELAALGWAFDRQGVDDMATFLATEAPDRMHYPYLAAWWPELQAWLDARIAAAAGKPSEYDPAL